MSNQYKKLALHAVRNLHGDTSVDLHETLDALEEVRALADELIDAVNADIDAEEEHELQVRT